MQILNDTSKCCIIIPCYNEASRLDVEKFTTFASVRPAIHFLFVNDGSIDNTAVILDRLSSSGSSFSFINLEINCGKAEAVRQGAKKAFTAGFEFVGFLDADLSTPLSEIDLLVGKIIESDSDIVMGCRLQRLGATIDRSNKRHYLGRVFATFASIILKMHVYDTQCGAKLFKSSQYYLFDRPFITQWLFDIEILARYRNFNGLDRSLNKISEVPLNEWKEVGGSKLKLKHLIKVPFELLKIHRQYN